MSEAPSIPPLAPGAGPSAPRRVWALVSGALGDTISHWPLFRAIIRQRIELTLVGQGEKVGLAAAEIPRSCPAPGEGGPVDAAALICAHDSERPEFVRLWQGRCDAADVQRGVELVITPHDAPEFLGGLRLMFPGAEIAVHPTSGYADDSALWRRFDVAQLGGAAVAPAPIGTTSGLAPVTIHLGAGSPAKRWPLAHFRALRRILCGELLAGEHASGLVQGRPVNFIFGEVERERFTATEKEMLGDLLGSAGPTAGTGFIADLRGLAEVIRRSAVFVGADTGPTHLAAQMGIPTIGLYSAEQSPRWHARGPRVQILTTTASGQGRSQIEGIGPEAVAEAVRRSLGPLTLLLGAPRSRTA